MRNREEAKKHILQFISNADSISIHRNNSLDIVSYSKTLDPYREDRDPNLFFIFLPHVKKVNMHRGHITFTDEKGISYRLYRYIHIENVHVKTNGYNIYATISRSNRKFSSYYEKLNKN